MSNHIPNQAAGAAGLAPRAPHDRRRPGPGSGAGAGVPERRRRRRDDAFATVQYPPLSWA